MDRLYWSSVQLHDHENFVTTAQNVKIYDGDDKKTHYEDGTLVLTSHRLIWTDSRDEKVCLAVDHSNLVLLEDEPPSFTRSGKVICHFEPVTANSRRVGGPISKSLYNHIRLSFSKGGHTEFLRQLSDVFGRRLWEVKQPAATPSSNYQVSKLKTGIAGIERKLQQEQRKADTTISVAFEDLNNLMQKAQEMVNLSKSIASKIEQKQGSITEDETIKFKSYLLSLGIPDPVTRDAYKSNSKYLQQLANQISTALEQPLKEAGGVMALTDAYCRINRARGMELLSPQDMLDACKLLSSLHLPVTLKTYDSGVSVIQLSSNDEKHIVLETSQAVEDNESLSAEEYAEIVGLSVIIAKERLLLAESCGKLCRDETIEGLRFYTNRFILEGNS